MQQLPWTNRKRYITSLTSFQINGETTSGGIAHWITSQVAGTVRTNATDWTAAYRPYIDGIIKESVEYQVTKGGPLLGTSLTRHHGYELASRHSESPSAVQIGE